MSDLFRIYTYILTNIIDVLLLLRFTETNVTKKIPVKYKSVLICAYLVYALLPVSIFLITILLSLLFLIVVTRPHFKQGLSIFIKYELYSHISMFVILFLHSLIFNDYVIFYSSDIYEYYKLIIVFFLRISHMFYIQITKRTARSVHTTISISV